MRVRVLGPVEVVDARGRVSALGSRHQRIVLAVLAAHAGRVVDADRLIDALWGDRPPRTATNSLRSYVSRLRRVLADDVAIHQGGYALVVPPEAIDAERFERLAATAAASSGAQAVARFEEALALWRGPAFGDVADVEAVRGAALRLEELHTAAREGRARALVTAGREAEAAAAAEELVTESPLREEAWAVLVEALAATGRLPEALRAYQRVAAVLADAGLEPSPRLRRAEAVALTGERRWLAPRRFPVPASSIVGREVDVDRVSEMLRSTRIVTLTGPGGVGKTRLALEVAHGIAGRHEWGARLVELGDVDDPAAVVGVVSDALGLTSDQGPGMERLAAAGDLDLLVVVDNCDHLIGEAARAVEALVTGGPRVRILATSRERLGVAGEWTWVVAPLAVHGPTSPAHRLFLERARAAFPGLTVTEDTAAAVDRVVRRLDGLPLAIEMAAARAATLPLTELADHLEDRLDLLPSPWRTGASRHRTLGSVVAWSEALLDDPERTLFAEMAVFAGPVGADDVAAVTGRAAPLPHLTRLAERSLLVAEVAGPRARFRMLQTIRAHAARRLAEAGRADELAGRHAGHIVRVTAEADHELRTPAEAAAYRRLDELGSELRAAHRWARTHDVELAVELSAGLFLFALSRLRDEPLRWAEGLATRLVEREPAPRGAAAVLASAAQRAVQGGELERGRALAEQGIALAGDSSERRFPLEVLADVYLFGGQLETAAGVARQLLTDAEESGDLHSHVNAVALHALTEAYAGRAETARRLLKTAPARSSLAPSDQGWLAYTEGEILLDREPDRALGALQHAIALADTVDNRYLGGVARLSACSLQARVGEPTAALDAFASVIAHWRVQGAVSCQLTTLRNLAVLLRRLGAAPEAAEVLGVTRSHAVRPTFGDEAARLADVDAWVRATLGDHEARRRMDAGAASSIDDAALAAQSWIARLGPSTPRNDRATRKAPIITTPWA